MGGNILKNTLVLSIIASLLCISVIPSTVSIDVKQKSKPSLSGNTLYVGGNGTGNYSSIQDAIDSSSDGDTIFVFSGSYYENVVVDKSISVIGEDKNSTYVFRDNDTWFYVFHLVVGDIKLCNFTIQKGKAGIGIWNYQEDIDNIHISNCNIVNNSFERGGLYIEGPILTNLKVDYCYFGNNGDIAVNIDPWSEVPISDIMFSYCCFDVDEIIIYHSKNLTFRNCEFPGSEINIRENCTETYFYNCNIDSSPEIALSLASSNVIIDNCTFTNNSDDGLRVKDSGIIENVLIRNCVFRNNYLGILIMNSAENVEISDCIIEDNEIGILFGGGLYNSIVENCHISNNKEGIIHYCRTKFQKFYRNNFIDNEIHIHVDLFSYFPLIHFNYYKNNYWDDWKGSGPYRVIKENKLMGFLNWDWNPALEPYDIGV